MYFHIIAQALPDWSDLRPGENGLSWFMKDRVEWIPNGYPHGPPSHSVKTSFLNT